MYLDSLRVEKGKENIKSLPNDERRASPVSIRTRF
jgi:hypothetical protein